MEDKQMKKLIALLLAVVMVFALAACANTAKTDTPAQDTPAETTKTDAPAADDTQDAAPAEETPAAEDGEKLVFGATFMSQTNEHFLTITEGLQAWCDANGHELVVLDPNYDASIQMTELEDFIEMGIDGLFISPVDGESIVPALEKVMAAGIPVIAIDAHPANEDDLDGLVSANNYMAGYQAGKALCEAIGGKGQVAFIDYYIKDYTVSQRDQGYYDALAEYPDVELVYEEVAKGSADTALPIAEDILTMYPDLAGFICINDPTAQGAYAACEGAGRTDVKITSVDGSQTNMGLIKEGKVVATASQRPYDLGVTAAEQMSKLLNGETIEHYIEIDTICIDASNVDEYYKG